MTHKLLDATSSVDENRFTGIANVMGTMDRGGDVTQPGAFSGAIPGFLKTGFVGLAHDWDALPVAMPDAAEERDGDLWVTAVFHSTRAAQAARSVVKERLAQGLQVGLSIGFRTDPADCIGFRSGPDLLTYARRNGLVGLDEITIGEWRRPCRLVRRVAELFEVSIVAVPMSSGSRVIEAKSPLEILRADLEASTQRVTRARIG